MDEFVSMRNYINLGRHLRLVGKVFGKRDIRRTNGGDAMVSLGRVDVLRTNKENLESDYKRVLNEIKEDTLQIIYGGGQLVPRIELHGNQERVTDGILKKLEGVDGFVLKNPRMLRLKDYTPYVTLTSEEGIELDFGERYTNPESTGYVVAVSSSREESHEILERMHSSVTNKLGNCSFNAVDKIVSPEMNSWKVGYYYPTRTPPEYVASSLVDCAQRLVTALKG